MVKNMPSNQLTLLGCFHPFDQELSKENRWVKLTKVIFFRALPRNTK